MKNKFDELWDKLVPESGQANSVQGELLRAIGRMAHDYFANGSANWSEDYETLSDFVIRHLSDSATFDGDSIRIIRNDVQAIQSFGCRERKGNVDLDAAFVRLQSFAVTWCDKHPDLKSLPSVEGVKLKHEVKRKSCASATRPNEPSDNHLDQIRTLVKLTLISFESQLIKLNPSDLLPRYNSILIELSNLSNVPVNYLFISVHRKGSKIGEDNVFTEVVHVPELIAGRKCRYEVLSFDGFNVPFVTIELNLTTPAEYSKRRLGENYEQKAIKQTKFIAFVDE